MQPSLIPGLEGSVSLQVPESKLVPALYPESEAFQEMPPVFATGFLVGLMEWACLAAVNAHLDWPREQTVGTHIHVSHEAPTPPGLVVTATARLTAVAGRRLTFEVEAHDGIDVIGRGTHERFVIDRDRFQARAARKAPSP